MNAATTRESAAALFDDLAKMAGGIDVALVHDIMKRHPEKFLPMIKSALAADEKHADKPAAPAGARKRRPGHRPGFDADENGVLLERNPDRSRFDPGPNGVVRTAERVLSERQRRLVRDLQNMPSLTGGRKLSEAEAVARVLAAEQQHRAVALSEAPPAPLDRKLEDAAVRKLMRGTHGLRTEAEARAAVRRMHSRFRQ